MWLLELELAGAVRRFSTERVTVIDEAGKVWTYAQGLKDPSPVEALGDEDRSTRVDVVGPNWADLVAQGVDLWSGSATLRRWQRDTVLERSLTWQVGDVVNPEYGIAEEGLTFSLERRPWDDTATVPGQAEVIDETTWPVRGSAPSFVIDDIAYGVDYPVIIGVPGYVGALSGAAAPITPGAPAYLVDYTLAAALASDSILLIAGHRVDATEVRIYDLSDGVNETRDVQHRKDLLGRTVAFVDFVGTVNLRPHIGHEYRSSWGPGSGGGLLNRRRTSFVRGAGELIIRLLEGHSIELEQGRISIDLGRMETQRRFLDRVLVDTWISERVHPWQWIADYLLPILPADVVMGSDGLYLQAWESMSDRTASIFDLNADTRQVTRVGRAAFDTSEVASEFVLHYALAPVTQRHLLTKRVGAKGAEQSYLCRLAHSRYQQRLWEMTTDVVSDQASASYIVQQQIRRKTRPQRPLTYQGGPELEALYPAAQVSVTDRDYSLTRAPARVTALQRGASPSVEVELLDPWPQTDRRVS